MINWPTKSFWNVFARYSPCVAFWAVSLQGKLNHFSNGCVAWKCGFSNLGQSKLVPSFWQKFLEFRYKAQEWWLLSAYVLEHQISVCLWLSIEFLSSICMTHLRIPAVSIRLVWIHRSHWNLASKNATEAQDADFLILVCLTNLADYYMLIYSHCWSRWSQWEVMAASPCCSWWCLDSLWVKLIRLWPHSFFLLEWYNSYLQSVIVESSLPSHRYASLEPFAAFKLPAGSGSEEGWCSGYLHAHACWTAHCHACLCTYWSCSLSKNVVPCCTSLLLLA
jgi:hypothetical protein